MHIRLLCAQSLVFLHVVACGNGSTNKDTVDGAFADGRLPKDGSLVTDGPVTQPDARGASLFTLVHNNTGVQRIIMGGVDILGGTGGYYIIGSCTGADDHTEFDFPVGFD